MRPVAETAATERLEDRRAFLNIVKGGSEDRRMNSLRERCNWGEETGEERGLWTGELCRRGEDSQDFALSPFGHWVLRGGPSLRPHFFSLFTVTTLLFFFSFFLNKTTINLINSIEIIWQVTLVNGAQFCP